MYVTNPHTLHPICTCQTHTHHLYVDSKAYPPLGVLTYRTLYVQCSTVPFTHYIVYIFHISGIGSIAHRHIQIIRDPNALCANERKQNIAGQFFVRV